MTGREAARRMQAYQEYLKGHRETSLLPLGLPESVRGCEGPAYRDGDWVVIDCLVHRR